jgi:signal transduction histidine kinase
VGIKLFRKIPHWGQVLPWVRLLLALAAVGIGFSRFADSGRTLKISGFVFLAFATLRATRTDAQNPAFNLLALFCDTVFFLILASTRVGTDLWIGPIFYLYLLATAVTLHNPREAMMVIAIAIAFCVLVAQGSQLAKTSVVAGVLASGFSLYRYSSERRIAELAKIAEEEKDAAESARQLERQRIAADFHDGPLQVLISFQMRLEILRKLLERDSAAGIEELGQLQKLSQTQVRELRAFVRSMRPTDPSANLLASARRVAEDFQKESGIPVTFIGAETPFSAAPEVCTDILQMIREALYNIRKHAGATRVAVAIEKIGKVLEISIDDNGRGFHFSGTYSLEELELLRLGPVSLKQRARSLNADLMLESRPGSGAGLKLRVPIQA